MKTLLLIIAATLAACTPTEAADPRRDTAAATIALYESQAIAQARQSPEVIKLRFALIKATTEAEKKAISASLYAIMESAASSGRQRGLLAVEESRRRDAELHRQWDEERRHEELLITIQNLRR